MALSQWNFTFGDLKPCSLNSNELWALDNNSMLVPCVLYDIQSNASDDLEERASTITIVQVTPAFCPNHRDGAMMAVKKLNADNNGRGMAIGFAEQHYVKFRLVSTIAGNCKNLTDDDYNLRHESALDSMISELGAPYIVGTCSGAGTVVEKAIALKHKAILMAQVGPPGYYEDENPYVFGFHINSDVYPLSNVRALKFLIDNRGDDPATFPISVISRTKAEFFKSTCQSAVDTLQSSGFANISEYFFDPSADEDGNGILNQNDEAFLSGLADAACPPGSGNVPGFHPALFICTIFEQDVIVNRLKENGCSPTSMWVTAAAWRWGSENPDIVPYMQSGGQWHRAFEYSDAYFPSGRELLDYGGEMFGYTGNYDQVTSYSVAILFAEHARSQYRVVDEPNPTADFSDDAMREILRRQMMMLTSVKTPFGPIVFDGSQRNVGREAASFQWLPSLMNDDEDDDGVSLRNALVNPYLQAEAQTVIPSPNALDCAAGSFFNDTLAREQGAMLLNSCSPCPHDTYTLAPSRTKQCNECPQGSSTAGLSTNEYCIYRDDNLLPAWMIGLAYTLFAISWSLSIYFAVWLLRHREDAVVNLSQIDFLLLLCFGAVISSSTVVAMSIQAGANQDEFYASMGCVVAPFLYAIGWVLQYGCLSAKTYRLYKVMQNSNRIIRETTGKMSQFVVVCLLVDLAILICWSILSPLQYQRTDSTSTVDEITGMVTIESVGRCVASNPDYSAWYFASPLLGFHVALMIFTNILLYKVKVVSDRYQERKHVAMASVLMFEILIVGVPVFVAVSDSPVAVFAVLTGFIALTDIGTLCCIFLPKISYQKQGLAEGVSVSESILRDTHKKAALRESINRSFAVQSSSRVMSCSGEIVKESIRPPKAEVFDA